jgi:hypothetical protein
MAQRDATPTTAIRPGGLRHHHPSWLCRAHLWPISSDSPASIEGASFISTLANLPPVPYEGERNWQLAMKCDPEMRAGSNSARAPDLQPPPRHRPSSTTDSRNFLQKCLLPDWQLERPDHEPHDSSATRAPALLARCGRPENGFKPRSAENLLESLIKAPSGDRGIQSAAILCTQACASGMARRSSRGGLTRKIDLIKALPMPARPTIR